MFNIGNAIKWLRRNWYGALIAYLITFSVVYGIIWYYAEPIGIKDSFENLPDFAKTRIFIHLLLTFFITAHVIILLLVIELNFFKEDSINKIELISIKDDPIDKYGIKIHSPMNGDEVGSPFRISGSYKIKPPEGQVRVLERSLTTLDYWLKGEAMFDENTKQWFVEKVYFASNIGEKRVILVAFLGENGLALAKYYEKANPQAENKIGIRYLTNDIQFCDQITLKRK